jgi:hypothetical protein
MKILFLDDAIERYFSFLRNNIGAEITWVPSAMIAIERLKEEAYDLVFLDHDLNEEHYLTYPDYIYEGTGKEVVKYIIDNARKFSKTKFYCHSLNFGGRNSMINSLRAAGLKAVDAPWAWEKSYVNN